MRKIIFLFALLFILCGQPAHAGIIHRLAKIASAPLWVVGFSAEMVGGFIVLPIKDGAYYFNSHPFVSF